MRPTLRRVLIALAISGGLLSAACRRTASDRGGSRLATQADSTAELAARYRGYREALRRGDAPPEYRSWSGPVHEVLADLGERLAAARCTRDRLVQLMGEPDETLSAGEDHNGRPVPEGETHLAYWWRGGHDYLYFVVRNGAVERAEWWFAGD